MYGINYTNMGPFIISNPGMPQGGYLPPWLARAVPPIMTPPPYYMIPPPALTDPNARYNLPPIPQNCNYYWVV